jgi:hypothetical protein
MLRKLIAAILATSSVVSSAQAARLTEIQGTVLVNTGDGFWEVKDATSVSAGDRVLVRGKGSAQVDYGSGCIVRVLANQTVVVASAPTCKPVITAAIQTKRVSMKEVPAPPPPPPLNDGTSAQQVFIVGGLLLIGTATAAMAAGKDKKASSPNEPLEDPESSSMAADAAFAAIAFTQGDNEDGSPVSP